MEAREKCGISTLDLLKFICAVLVVGIHTEPFQSIRILDMGFGVLTRCAVPIFFAISGYLFFSRKTKLVSFIKKNGVMYLFWIAVYRIVDILKADSLEPFSFVKIVRIFAGGGYSTLWFFQALLVSIVLVHTLYLFTKSRRAVFGFAIVLYVLGLSLSTYYDIAQKIPFIVTLHDSHFIQFVGTRNGLFYAPVFVSLGLLLSNAAEKWKCDLQKKLKSDRRSSFNSDLAIIVICFLGLAAESAIAMLLIDVSSTVLWIMVVPLVYCIIRFAIKHDKKSNEHSVVLRQMSLGIYLLHPLVMQVMQNSISGIILFIAVFVISLILSMIAIIAKRRWKVLSRVI